MRGKWSRETLLRLRIAELSIEHQRRITLMEVGRNMTCMVDGQTLFQWSPMADHHQASRKVESMMDTIEQALSGVTKPVYGPR